ncbi:MAG: type I 3-dehydroquinate dehydratase [Actinomycetaceae bacterium]|nr:type I 3-dehydroquinate dehydratase [Arcanobacterium sp.]MDD7687576.1 type I 3-dehydroquinate dehydratase [Actinomycetaceae bacterium]MDY5273186.1 type I 3-dehydroquinate dehydratase [Arcanobacterium sp.]
MGSDEKYEGRTAAEVFAPAYGPDGKLVRERPSVIVPLTGTTAQMLVEEARAAEAAGADIVEWRSDFMLATHEQLSFAPLGKDVVTPIVAATNIPLLLTIRTSGQGGEAKLRPGRYRLLLAEMLDTLMHIDVPPERIAIDLEHWFEGTPALARRAQEMGLTVVISHHDWSETPDPEIMQIVYEDMLELPGVVAKLAVMAHDDADVQNLLDVCARVARSSRRAIMAISMGEMGKRSRFEGGSYGSVATFGTVGTASAPGQPTVEELLAALHR